MENKERLTKAELVNGFPVCYLKNNSGVGEIVIKDHPYREIVEKLKYYEDLEEKLKQIYGEHEGLLDQVIEGLVKYEGKPSDRPYRARLLTDGEADKWMRWKKLNGQGRLKEFPCAVGDHMYEINRRRNVISEYRVKAITVSGFGIFIEWSLIEGIYCNLRGINDYEIGKTVFFTKEQAKAELKKEIVETN